MFSFETIIGQALTNLAGNTTCSNLFFGIGGTTNCGLYAIGILTFIFFAVYAFARGIGSDAIYYILSVLVLLLGVWGLLPLSIVFLTLLIMGFVVGKMVKQLVEG